MGGNLFIVKSIKNFHLRKLSLKIFLNDGGSPFDSTTEQHTYITEFYKNLYKKQQDSVDPQTIGDFLGHITTHEVVRNDKLSDREKTALDNPLTLIELDQSINDANMNSAPGINGISNKFIKKYWELFRYPLFNCDR